MKSEKGKPAFPGNVDAVLTDKIIEHTQKNTDGGGRETIATAAGLPSQKSGCCDNMSKTKCISVCIFFTAIIAGIIGFFIFRPRFKGMERRHFLNFFG
jgi:hypothetical protein